jgi:hypothetical protein
MDAIDIAIANFERARAEYIARRTQLSLNLVLAEAPEPGVIEMTNQTYAIVKTTTGNSG